LVYLIFLLVLAFVLQIIIWRIKLPEYQTKSLVILFSLEFILGSFLYSILLIIYPEVMQGKTLSLIQIFHLLLAYSVTSFSYILFYSAIEGTSPTFFILLSLNNKPENGYSLEELYKLTVSDKLVENKISGLIKDKHVMLTNGKLIITEKGINLFKVFNIYRRVVGINTKNG
jgi:hypothetical protein